MSGSEHAVNYANIRPRPLSSHHPSISFLHVIRGANWLDLQNNRHQEYFRRQQEKENAMYGVGRGHKFNASRQRHQVMERVRMRREIRLQREEEKRMQAEAGGSSNSASSDATCSISWFWKVLKQAAAAAAERKKVFVGMEEGRESESAQIVAACWHKISRTLRVRRCRVVGYLVIWAFRFVSFLSCF